MALGRGHWRSRPWRVAERCHPRTVIQELQPLNTLPAASSTEGDRRRTRTLHAPRDDSLSRGPRGMVSLGTGPQRLLGVRPWRERMHGWLSVGSPVSTPHGRHRRESHMLLSVGAEKASHKTPPSVMLDTLERGMQGDFLSVGQATCGPAADTCSGEGARGLPRDRDKTCWRCLSAESRGFWPERAIAPERSNRPGTRKEEPSSVFTAARSHA
ncbi:uncharacterized protein LOC144231735 [Crocuta crocuta]